MLQEIGPMLHPNMHKDEIDINEQLHIVKGIWCMSEKDLINNILSSSDGEYGKIFYRGMTIVYRDGRAMPPYPLDDQMPTDEAVFYVVAITHQDPSHICYKLYTIDDVPEYYMDICNPEFAPPFEDFENVTIDQVREIHRKIWDYAIEYLEKPHTMYISNCVLCSYASKSFKTSLNPHTDFQCDRCPSDLKCRTDGSLCDDWLYAYRCGNRKRMQELAKLIRDVEIQDP